MMNIKWYVLYVNTGQEHAVAEQLRHRGYDAIVPIENKLIRSKGKWIAQPHILFDGYVFIRMDYEWSKYYVFTASNCVFNAFAGFMARSFCACFKADMAFRNEASLHTGRLIL